VTIDPAVHLDAGLGCQLGVGHRADADQQLVALDELAVAGPQLDAGACLAHRGNHLAGADVDAVLPVDAEHRAADLGTEHPRER